MTTTPEQLGLTPGQWKTLHKHLIAPLFEAGATLWCFGSRARGDYRAHSDLDIMVEASSDLSAKLSEIREYFENSNFPFKIDLVEMRQFAASYLPSFEKDKRLLKP